MLTYNFENINLPLYEHLYNCLKNDIITGRLTANYKLPSKRTFATHNGISTITVQNAYAQLDAEGYIYTRPRQGYYVSDITQMKIVPKQARVDLDIKIKDQAPNYKLDLSSNQMNPENFPFSIWTKLLRKTISKRSEELMEVSPTGGKELLRQAIAQHLSSFRGMIVDPNQIIVGAGTEYLYGLLIQLLGADKVYCTENPGYAKLAQIYKQYGINPHYADIDEKGIKVADLKDCQAQIVHLNPNHHFPTGITVPAKRRYEILAWANEKNDRYIIEDDYDSEFRSKGRPTPTLFSIDAFEKVIYMNTFSKSLTPTIRISYMVLPAHLANRFYRELSFYSCTVSNFEQYTLAAFIKEGYFEKHLNRMILYYRRQRQRVMEIIEASPLIKKCELIENDSGLHFVLKLKTRLSDDEVIAKMKQHGYHLRSMADYYLRPQKASQHHFIINYSNLDLTLFREACQVLFELI